MNFTVPSGPGDLGWADVEACTLPTAERPLRLADFDDLFATTLQSIEQPDDTHARLLLVGGDSVSDRTQRLADEESSCCSFFTFGVSTVEVGTVVLDIAVPPAYADVLASLVVRAKVAQGAAS